MHIREVEEKTGLTRANIRFYEREGLLSPVRMENGYRVYTQQEVELLLRIKLLRALGIPIPQIRQLGTGEAVLQQVLEERLAAIQQEQERLARASEVCRTMLAGHHSYIQLPAETYLAQLEQPAGSPAARVSGLSFGVLQRDVLPREIHPWRRFLAVLLDELLYELPLLAVWTLVFRLNIGGFYTVIQILWLIGATLLLEPVFLHFWGRTPGKWVMGIEVTNEDGGRLSWQAAKERTRTKLSRGSGWHIPIYILVRYFKSWRDASAGETLAWETDSELTYRSGGWRLGLRWAAGQLVPLAVLTWIAVFSQLPPNRGTLSAAEFAENFNDIARRQGFSLVMNSDGSWWEAPGTYVIDVFASPSWTLTEEDGKLIRAEMTLDSRDDLAGCSNQMQLGALAWAGASREARFPEIDRHLQEIAAFGTENETMNWAGIQISYQVEQEGYNWSESNGNWWQEDENGHLRISFVMEPES